MTDLASTLVHDDIGDYAFVTMIAIGIVALLVGVISVIPSDYATAADVPSLAQLYL
ncbi:MAG TPA: hypothetical protein VJO12_00475 [Stellaceae bacterium]|nr:hypothetical protein [Stellaceae bacterium]